MVMRTLLNGSECWTTTNDDEDCRKRGSKKMESCAVAEYPLFEHKRRKEVQMVPINISRRVTDIVVGTFRNDGRGPCNKNGL
jgi:hypothetical protein